MADPRPLILALVIGAGAGAGGMFAASRPGSESALDGSPVPVALGDPHADCRAREAALTTKLSALEAQMWRAAVATSIPAPAPAPAAAPPPAPDAPAGTGAPAPTGPAAGSGGGAGDPQQDARRAARALVEPHSKVLRDETAPADQRAAAVRALLELLKSPDRAIYETAGNWLAAVADHLTPGEIALIERQYQASTPGAPTRQYLAAAVARGIAQEPRLAAFLAGLPPVDEPDIRSAVLRSLDTAPSAAYREWFIRLTRDERDLGVLDDAWDEDRLLAAATRDDAPRIATAIEGRLGDGTVKERPLRGLGYYAISIAGIQAPAQASAALDRCLAAETDDLVRALGQALVAIVRSGDATFAALEAVWDKHQRALRQK